MSIADKLSYLNTTKNILREAINRAGGSLTEETPFRQYADWIVNQSASLSADSIKQQYVVRDRETMFPVEVGDGVFPIERATPKWVWGPDGTLVEVPPDTLAIDHDPVTGGALGLLVLISLTYGVLNTVTAAAQGFIPLIQDLSISLSLTRCPAFGDVTVT